MIGEKLGHYFDRPLGPLAKRIGLHPNLITIVGFLVTAVAALALTRDLVLGGALMLLGGFFDMLDGAVARAQGRATDFGAFLDSVLDRYSDLLVLTGIILLFARTGGLDDIVGGLFAVTGTVMVSYTRARAESLGVECRVGLMERGERLLVLIVGALFSVLAAAVWVVAIGANLTAIHRIVHMRRATRPVLR